MSDTMKPEVQVDEQLQEIVEVPASQADLVASQVALPSPMEMAEGALEQWKAYRWILREIIEPSDLVVQILLDSAKGPRWETMSSIEEAEAKADRIEKRTGKRPPIRVIPKRSAMSKLAGAFRLEEVLGDGEPEYNLEILSSGWMIERVRHGKRLQITWYDERGEIVRSVVHVVIRRPDGKEFHGVGSCSRDERGFSKEHDIIATAATRARVRAIAEALGWGAVSAEEITSSPEVEPQPEVPQVVEQTVQGNVQTGIQTFGDLVRYATVNGIPVSEVMTDEARENPRAFAEKKGWLK